MSEMPKSQHHLQLAWKALLAGDTAERDRQCELSAKALCEEERTLALLPNDPLSKN